MKAEMHPERILSIDIGGTSVKAAVLNAAGEMLAPVRRCPTPRGSTPVTLLEEIVALVAPLGEFDAMSIGFPGAIKRNVILTAPNLGTANWQGTDLAAMASQRFGCPVRLSNDATMHGLGVIAGEGIEVVLTLGTGMGFALFRDGVPAPQIELGRHVAGEAPSYDDFVGDAALKRSGEARWKAHVLETLRRVRDLVNFDTLYLGGGNARLFTPDELPGGVKLAMNEAALAGGAKLWRDDVSLALK
ncbi:ROK family protein [Acidocella sp. KAb 2-4]|uniref:ROK family protein n=1 Tax=Acidocella sp. KAb 2-4 TaxID=2885158 RepID=UPI001D08ABD4|nr:ROK family protein [Acidocella sp. KAb 2-4]MCB5945595.1 ROK family protein [Acidocella sp. KAb 2-4]